MSVRVGRWILGMVLAASFSLSAQGAAPLKKEDVKKIMQEIFSRHVDQKKMTSKIIRKSLKEYIDQFDPDRTYLMESETEFFLNPSTTGLETYMQEYDNNNFEIYEKLNAEIQKAIVRAREDRKQLFGQVQALFSDSLNYKIGVNENMSDPDMNKPFVKTSQELIKRQRDQILQFLAAERQRYGNEEVTRNPKATLSVLNKRLMNHENQYLFQDEFGREVSNEQKENLLALHILKSMAGSLDAHTTVYNPVEAYDLKVRLEKNFQGIGVILKQGPHGEVKIASFVKGGPAEVSKQLEIDDQIVKIGDVDVSKDSFGYVLELLKGKNTPGITLTVKRTKVENGQSSDKEIEVHLQRAPITLNEERVETNYLTLPDQSGIIGKITLNSFYQGENGLSSEKDIKNAIKKLGAEGDLRGLILDLRENSGGFLSQAVKVAGLFITNGVVVVSKYANGEERFYRDVDGKVLYDGPLIILTSKATASAAEIVAQALQDYGVALVVGDEHTYGKGTIQSQTVTENGAVNYFKVTVGEYFSPSGRTPQIQGVKADIVVPSPFNKEHIGEEYLDGALKPEQIAASFDDPLIDVQPAMKQWYMRYYTPSIQKPTDRWRRWIPDLTTKSEARTKEDKGFQAYITWIDEAAKPKQIGVRAKFANPDFDSKTDYQMREAVNILKDMISDDAMSRYVEDHTIPHSTTAQ